MTSLAIRLVAVFGLLAISACAREDLSKPPAPIGDFRLGYNVVVADKAKAVGPSRTATPEEWEAVIAPEIAKRLDRYDGNKLYHIGIAVDAYALAVPGVPVVLSPKSVLAITLNVFDDTAGMRITPEPVRFTVFERLSGETVVGSGLTQSREQQMQNLASNAARQVADWLVANKELFAEKAVAERAALAAEKAAKSGVAPAVPAPAATAALPAVPPPSAAPSGPVPAGN